MKAMAMKLLVVVVLALGFVIGDVNTKHSRDVTNTVVSSDHRSLRGVLDHQRMKVEQPPQITQLVWLRSDTNQRTFVDTSVLLVPNDCYTPIDIDFDNDPIRNLTVEAITSASTGSVTFSMDGDYSSKYEHVKNNARYVMCGNVGDNILQCPEDTFPQVDVKLLTVTPYSGKSVTGVAGTPWNLYLNYKSHTSPDIKLYLVNPVTDFIYMDKPLEMSWNEPGNSWITDPSLGTYFNFLLSATAGVDYESWVATKVEFILDNGAFRRTDTKAPFSAFGNTGNDYNLYELSNGRHTLEARVYKPNGELGYTFETAFTIQKPN